MTGFEPGFEDPSTPVPGSKPDSYDPLVWQEACKAAADRMQFHEENHNCTGMGCEWVTDCARDVLTAALAVLGCNGRHWVDAPEDGDDTFWSDRPKTVAQLAAVQGVTPFDPATFAAFDPPLTEEEAQAFVDAAEDRNDDVHLRVEPCMRFGAPHIRGIPAESIAGMVSAGETPEVVLDEFGLTRPDVLVACWFMAVYGARLAVNPAWDLWGAWVDEHHRAMAAGDWGQVPDPPEFPPVDEGGGDA